MEVIVLVEPAAFVKHRLAVNEPDWCCWLYDVNATLFQWMFRLHRCYFRSIFMIVF